MHSILHLVGFLAGALGLVAYVPYVRDILRRKTQPDRFSWMTWALEYTVLFFAQLASGAASSLWLIAFQLLAVCIISLLSIRYGSGMLDRQKILLLVCAGMAMVAWWSTKNASLATYFLLTAESLGVIPTVVKAYRHPGSETLLTWALIGTAGTLGVFAVGHNAPIAVYIYPIALALINFSVVGAMVLGKHTTFWRHNSEPVQVETE